MIKKKPISNPSSERLLQARLSRGLSGTELAEKMEISKQSIYQFERGVASPSIATITKYQEILNFPYCFFFKPSVANVESGAYHFRKLRKTRDVEKGIVRVWINWMIDLYNDLSEFIETPKFQVLLKNQETYSKDELENIADELRKYWNLGLGPISNITSLLENKGFMISKWDSFGEDADACTKIINLDGKVKSFSCVTDKDTRSACRMRFSLIHELAHVVLHSWADQEYIDDKNNHARMEKEANYFAGAFLMPMDSLFKEIYSFTNIESYIALKARWKISISAMVYRAKELNFLTDNQFLYLQKQISYKRIREKEPLDDIIPIENPLLYNSAINMILDENVATGEDLLNMFSLPVEEINQICGFQSNNSPFSSSVSKKINLRIVY